jgi:N,N-dimethylformamidase
MKVVGYGDRLSVPAGGRIEFKVSCEEPSYEAAFVQPSHIEALRRELEAPLNGTHPGRLQTFPLGSYVRFAQPVPRPAALRLELWIFPTAPERGGQELLAWEDGDGLFVADGGLLELRSGGAALTATTPLRPREWYRVSAVVDADGARLSQVPLAWEGEDHVRGPLAPNPATAAFAIGRGFDGKIDSPRVEGVASWDFSLGIQTTRVHDAGPRALHGEVVNMPARGVTGHDWSGEHVDYRSAPRGYGAIHFHSDDLEDALWETDFALDIPADLASGLYAIRLRTGGEEDQIPFFVTAPAGASERARIAFLAPTFSYLAYSCETSGTKTSPFSSEEERLRKEEALSAGDHYAADEGLLSLYDHHRDGSGVCFVSRLRPLPNMRPDYISPPISSAHQLGADLHVIDWLREFEEPFEVITDEDLHHGGIEALAPYRAVLTGTHPEYWSGEMLDAASRFMESGGGFMYLGGNGMYWVTDPHPERPHVVEVRRTHAGTRAWQSEPGECFQQTTGGPSGLWRFRGRPPHAAFGVGMAGHGYDFAIPYKRSPESFDEAVAWIFEGVGEEEPIGDFGALMGGAGGFEIDSFDHAQGTPPGTVLLATAQEGFSDSYNGVVENVLMEDSRSMVSVNPAVRADMTYLAYPGGGACFSTGSVCWGGSLTHDGCRNNVSTITANVLRRFAAGE